MVAHNDRPTTWWGRSEAQEKTPTDLMNEDDINERFSFVMKRELMRSLAY
jgi:hypothetical protein